MQQIIANIFTLVEYFELLKQNRSFIRPDCCPICQASHVHFHGYYLRKPDRGSNSDDNQNPVKIYRFYCPACKCTCSVLPECIAPARWYMWQIQQIVILACLAGKSLRAMARENMPSRHTIKRWWSRLQDQFTKHSDLLKTYLSELGRTSDIKEFWRRCLDKIKLSTAMRILHDDGIPIP